MLKILVVEDDKHTRKLLKILLEDNGFDVVTAIDGQDGLNVMEKEIIDLIIADIMMPNMNGYDFCSAIRESGINSPIILLTAKSSLEDKKKGFNIGVDDYLTKPFNEEELLLRVNALLRRSNISTARKIVIGEVTLDYDSLTVKRGPEETLLPKKEFYLLYKFLSYPNIIFTRYQLMDEFWGMESESDEHTLNVHINRLRNRFKDYPEFEIQTIRGLGYRAVKKI